MAGKQRPGNEGAIECREPAGALNWTFYVTDFSQYGLPVTSGPAGLSRATVSDDSKQARTRKKSAWLMGSYL